MCDPDIRVQSCHSQTERHGASVADRIMGIFEQFPNETCAILKASTVFVDALVLDRGKELQRHVAVGSVDVDDVEAAVAGTDRGGTVIAPECGDVGLVHGAGLPRGIARRHAHGADGYSACQVVATGISGRPQFHPCQSSVSVHGFRHSGERKLIVIVPNRAKGMRVVVRRRLSRTVFGTDNAPAAFGLHFAHCDGAVGHRKAHPRTMGDLVEAIGCRDRADPDRLEEDVVCASVSHAISPAVPALVAEYLRRCWLVCHWVARLGWPNKCKN